MVKLFLIDLSILQFSKVYLQITVIIGVDPYSAIDIRSQKVTAHRCIFASFTRNTESCTCQHFILLIQDFQFYRDGNGFSGIGQHIVESQLQIFRTISRAFKSHFIFHVHERVLGYIVPQIVAGKL